MDAGASAKMKFVNTPRGDNYSRRRDKPSWLAGSASNFAQFIKSNGLQGWCVCYTRDAYRMGGRGLIYDSDDGRLMPEGEGYTKGIV